MATSTGDYSRQFFVDELVWVFRGLTLRLCVVFLAAPVRTCMHACMHACIYTDTHTHTHTHTLRASTDTQRPQPLGSSNGSDAGLLGNLKAASCAPAGACSPLSAGACQRSGQYLHTHTCVLVSLCVCVCVCVCVRARAQMRVSVGMDIDQACSHACARSHTFVQGGEGLATSPAR